MRLSLHHVQQLHDIHVPQIAQNFNLPPDRREVPPDVLGVHHLDSDRLLALLVVVVIRDVAVFA